MSKQPIPDSLNDFPAVYAPRRQYAYVIVREPDSFVLFKAYNDNCGTVRLLEFPNLKEALSFVDRLPKARVVVL